jgi:hypothetical protein
MVLRCSLYFLMPFNKAPDKMVLRCLQKRGRPANLVLFDE